MRQAVNRGRVFVAVTQLLIGIGLATAMSRSYFAQRRAATVFVPTRALILTSAMSDPPRMSSKDTTYTLKLRYQYAGGASVDTGTTFSYVGVGYATQHEANAALQRYPAGGQVTAYYDPKKPSHSVLDRTPPTLSWSALILAIYLAVGVYLLQSGIRGKKWRLISA